MNKQDTARASVTQFIATGQTRHHAHLHEHMGIQLGAGVHTWNPALERLRQEDFHKLEASLGYRIGHCHNTHTKRFSRGFKYHKQIRKNVFEIY